MEDPHTIRLHDGRTLAFDDVGDRAGLPVLYLHGTPDSRRSRHPDDGLARAAGVRLIAVDRPGAGDSTPDPDGRLADLGRDLAALLEHLGVGEVALLGWSAGGLSALAAATVLGRRVAAMALVATVPPVEAYGDPAVVAALGPGRRGFVELAAELSPAEVAREVAPYLVPLPLTAALALEHVLDGAGEQGRVELASVPGAAEALAEGLIGSVAAGPAGLEHDTVRQLERGLDLAAVRAPVRSLHGGLDPISPPAVGAWLAARLPDAAVDVRREAGHHLLFTRWEEILVALRSDAHR
ncbi:MAG: alpha/beta fold hydrolase [Acidimicrobiales bacterium]